MKRLMAIAALAFGPLACVANQGDAPIRFLQARALEFDDGCTGSDEFVISEGSLDISGGQNYLMALSVETNNLRQPISIGQEIFSDQGLNDITLNEIIYSYEVQPITTGATVAGLPADEEDRAAYYGVFRPETDPNETYTFIRAFGPKALAALGSSLSPGSAVTVLSTIKARGKLSSGQTVESNKFTFPVTVYATGRVYCPPGQVPAGTCRIPGQDVAGCVEPEA